MLIFFTVCCSNGDTKFFIHLLEKAILQYQYLENNVMDMYHTGVPPKQQGKGIAGCLVKVSILYSGTAEDGGAGR